MHKYLKKMDDSNTHFNYAGFLDALGGDRDMVEKMIAVSKADLKEKLETLGNAIKNGDARQIAVLTHYIKGAALTARYNKMAGIAADMELLAKDELLETMEDNMTLLNQEWDRVLKVIEKVM